MAAPQNFRSALNGFNREDVVNYLSFLSNKHETQLNALRMEAEELRRELESRDLAEQELRGQLEEMKQLHLALEQQLEQQEALREEAQANRQELERLHEETLEKAAWAETLEQTAARQSKEIARLTQELAAAKTATPQKPEQPDYTAELNAYRRAESAERRAMERVNQMYDQANGVIAEASLRAQRTAEEIGTLAAGVQAELEKLQQAIGNSGSMFADTAAVLGDIRPEAE